MSASIDFIAVVYLLGAAQALVFVVLLLRAPRSAQHANRCLAAFLLTFALALVDEFLLYTRYYRDVPQLLGVLWPLDFVYGPLMYFYFKALTEQHFVLTRKYLAHFIPLAISITSYTPFMLLSGTEKFDLVFAPTALTGYHSVFTLIALAAMVQILVYIILLILHLKRHSRAVAQNLSYREGVDLRWLRNLVLACFTLWALFVLRDLLLPLWGMGGADHWSLPVAIAVAVYVLGYFGHRQPEIFGLMATTPEVRRIASEAQVVEGDSPNNEVGQATPTTDKYQKSALSESHAQSIHQQLIAVMQAEKLYLDNELTLSTLAQRLTISTHHLSQVINEQVGCNFFDFINEYRVREAQALLTDPAEQRSSILALSMQAGFKSKSAFYKAFRKHMGMTPAQYRESLSEFVAENQATD